MQPDAEDFARVGSLRGSWLRQAGRYHALGLGLVAVDLLIKSGVCKRYRDVTVYAADASHFVGKDLFSCKGSSSGGFAGDVIGGVSMMSSLLVA